MSADTKVRALRGAITVPANDAAQILDATRTLLDEMILLNSLDAEQLVSVIFTATPDLTAVFPARAARELGWSDVPLLCMTEMAVPGSLPRCVRVLMHAELPAEAGRGRHVYLGGAAELRPDLAKSEIQSSVIPAPSVIRARSVIPAPSVIPAKAGIHVRSSNMDPRFRGDDGSIRGDDVGPGPRSSDDGGILCEDDDRRGRVSDSALTSARLETLDEL
ncbi:MAG TPA: chorismate mutase [Gemmatimonadaceae bacterium]|nr:chorismate mutase [Gemmatimonadaceae bacterium]